MSNSNKKYHEKIAEAFSITTSYYDNLDMWLHRIKALGEACMYLSHTDDFHTLGSVVNELGEAISNYATASGIALEALQLESLSAENPNPKAPQTT